MIHIWLGASPSGRGSVRFLGVGMMNKGGEMHTASKRSSLRTCKRLRLRKMRTVPTDLLRPNSRKNMFGVSAMTGEREPDSGDRGLRYIRNENNSSFESFELAMTRVTGSVTPKHNRNLPGQARKHRIPRTPTQDPEGTQGYERET